MITTTAAQMFFHSHPDQVAPKERELAKSCIYACIYGAGPKSIAQQVNNNKAHQ